MYPLQHIIISAPLATAVGLFTRSLPAGLLCFFSGFLIDVDHFLEYTKYYGLNHPRPSKIFQACAKMASTEERGRIKCLFLIFHGVEFALLFWIAYALSANIYLLAIACGYSAHLIADASYNSIKPQAYFITIRIKHKFETAKLIRAR
ncbi:MAG: hypothetical protein V1727_00890 [Candidatus Omnitrophota bacterium]